MYISGCTGYDSADKYEKYHTAPMEHDLEKQIMEIYFFFVHLTFPALICTLLISDRSLFTMDYNKFIGIIQHDRIWIR